MDNKKEESKPRPEEASTPTSPDPPESDSGVEQKSFRYADRRTALTSSLHSNRRYLVVGLLGLVGWLTWMAIADREQPGAETVVVVEPRAGYSVDIENGGFLGVRGNSAAGAECTVGLADHAGRRVDTSSRGRSLFFGRKSKSEFAGTLGPFNEYGQKLAWLDVDCDDGSNTRYARMTVVDWARHEDATEVAEELAAVVEGPAKTAERRAEVARVRFDASALQSAIRERLHDDVRNVLANYRLSSDYRGLRLDGSPSLDVRNGFYLRVPLRVDRTKGCNVRVWFYADVRIGLGWNSDNNRAVANVSGWSLEPRRHELTGFCWFFAWAAFWTDVSEEVRTRLEEEERRHRSGVQSLLRDRVNGYLDNFMEQGFNQLVDIGKKTVQRIQQEFALMDPGISRGESIANGEALLFSVDVSADWLGREAPPLDFSSEEIGQQVDIKLSYALVNRFLEILFDRPLQDLIDEGQSLVKTLNSVDSFASAIGEFGQTLDSAHQFLNTVESGASDFFAPLGVKLVPRQDLMLPIQVRPHQQDAVSVFASNIKLFEARSHIEIKGSAEGLLGLGRETSDEELGYLLSHLALEPQFSFPPRPRKCGTR